MKKRVFVTQIPHRIDTNTKALVPAINIGPSSEFGEPIVMYPPRANYYATKELSDQLYDRLKNFDFENDSLLPLGDPIICATACAVLAKLGNFRVLRWDKQLGRYTSAIIIS